MFNSLFLCTCNSADFIIIFFEVIIISFFSFSASILKLWEITKGLRSWSRFQKHNNVMAPNLSSYNPNKKKILTPPPPPRATQRSLFKSIGVYNNRYDSFTKLVALKWHYFCPMVRQFSSYHLYLCIHDHYIYFFLVYFVSRACVLSVGWEKAGQKLIIWGKNRDI